MESKPEVWQRGPVEGVPPLLQPVVHALLQVGEEARIITNNFPEEFMWERPADVASPAFHLMHIRGVVDRLFTYARKESLSIEQKEALAREGKSEENPVSLSQLLDELDGQINKAVNELRHIKEESLTEFRGIGRKQIPTTVIGLYTHAAEHSMRHIGQLLVTCKILKSKNQTDF